MNNKINIILFSVLVLLASLAFYSQQQTPAASTTILPDIVIQDINKIEITIRNESSASFRKNHNSWEILLKDKYVAADANKVSLLLSLLTTPSKLSFEANNNNLKKFGLQQPSLEIKFNNQIIAFGKTEPISRNRYLSINGFIHLIDRQYYGILISPAKSYAE